MDLIFPASLPRHGPGSHESTQRALAVIPKSILSTADILDLGCGTGPSTLILTNKTSGHVVAVDASSKYIEELKRRLEKQQESTRSRAKVTVLSATFEACDPSLSFLEAHQTLPKEYDIIWAEGSAYHAGGIHHVLPLWRKYLKKGGFIVVSELFIEPNAPEEVKELFNSEEMAPFHSLLENVALLRASEGWELVEYFVLDPERDWWKEYYGPLLENIGRIRCAHPELADLISEVEDKEIRLFRNHSDVWGYAFYVIRRVE